MLSQYLLIVLPVSMYWDLLPGAAAPPPKLNPGQTLGADCTATARARRAAHVQQRRNPPAIKAEQNGEQKGRSQAEGVSMGKLGGHGGNKERSRPECTE